MNTRSEEVFENMGFPAPGETSVCNEKLQHRPVEVQP
jgi:hypothetical protein